MRVLIVDDSLTMRMCLSSMARELTHRPSVAEDGREALELLSGGRSFDLALVDWDMPVMDGLAFVQAVRGNSAWDAMKIIMVTSRDSSEDILRALENGANDYLMKPIDTEMLADKLRLVGCPA